MPFVQRIGLEWKQGVLSVSQEHFATELLVNFLGSMWRKIQENNQGVTCVLSTLPEETHQLGLHMCALVAALAQMKIVYLGNNTPVEEIAGTVALSEASLLCISISSTYSTQDADRNLNKLRKGISKDVPIVVGGGGTPKKNLDGVLKFKNLLPFYDWLSSQSFKEIGK